MSNYSEVATWQTDCVCEWLDNDIPSYDAYIDRLERRGLFTASTAKRFVLNLWGDRTPNNEGMSRVRWGQVAEFLNSSPIGEGWLGMRIDEIKRRNRRAGKYFFSRDTMEAMYSIVYPNTRTVTGSDPAEIGILFVTSEKSSEIAPRLYSLRMFNPNTNDIATVGTYQGFLTLERALMVMRDYKWGSAVAAECDPVALSIPQPSAAVLLAELPGEDVHDQVNGFLAELGF